MKTEVANGMFLTILALRPIFAFWFRSRDKTERIV
jgi:hypothetical protein